MNLKKFLLAALVLLMGASGAWAETDYTNLMSNDWTNSSGGFQGGRERYQEANYGPGKVLYQSFTAPATGIYEIKFYAVASSTSGRGFANIYGDNIAQAFLTAGSNKTTLSMTVIDQTGCTLAEASNLRTLSVEAEAGETIEYGIENIGTGGNWYTAQKVSAKMKTVAEIYQSQYDEAYKIWQYSTENEVGAKATFKSSVDAMLEAMDGTLAGAQTASDNLAAAQAIYESKSYPIKGHGVKYDYTSRMNMAINAWTCKQGNGPAQYGHTGATETYDVRNSGEVMYQEITGLPSGEYEIHFYAVANAANGGGTAGSGLAYVYANDQQMDIDVILQNGCTPSDYERVFTVMVSNGTIKYGVTNKAVAGNWYVCKNVALYMTGAPDLSDYYEAIASNLETANSLIASKMNANDKTALQDAIAATDGYESIAVIGSLEEMNANLSSAVAAAEASVADYAKIEEAINNYASKVAALDAAGQAAYDASAIQAKYNNGDYTTFAEAETELQVAFASAVKAQTTVGSDWTGVIVNPSFENNFTGWTNEGGIVTQSNPSFSLKQGNLYVEFWQPSGTKSISQTIANMPAGVYELSVGTLARGVTSAKVFAGGVEKAITIEDVQKIQTLEFACDAGDITIGLEAVCTGADGSWIAADNFTLRLVSAGLPEVEAVTGKMNNATAAAQTSAIEVYNNNKTVENYNAAVNAINAASASVAAYASAKAAIEKAKGVIGETNFYTQEAYNAYNSAIAEAEQAYEDGTMEDATAAALENTLNGGTIYKPANVPMRDFYSSAWTATNGVSIYTNNWSVEGNGDGSNFLTPFIEDWVADGESLANTTLTASVTVPTAGEYKVTARVRMRLKNEGTAPVSGLSVQVAGGEPVAISGDTNYGVFYVTDVEATGFVTEPNGTLSVNFVVDGTNSSWLSIKALKYELVAEATAANMTITEAGWATFIAPFEVEIPAGVTAYTVEGVKVDNYLNKAAIETGVIPANTPVLLEGAAMTETFYGQSTATQDTYGDVLVGNVSGVTKNVPNNGESFVLLKQGGNLGFYKVASDDITVGNNRCYLNVPAGGEIKAFFFDDDATGINGVDTAGATVVERYNAAGMKVAAPVKGLNIVKLSNGKVQKVLVK